MDISLDDFRRHFELLSDETLLSTNREDLVANARPVYDEEVARRGLNSPAVEETPEAAPDAVPPEVHDDLVVISTYNIPDEANLARGLLHSAQIPYLMQNDYVALGGIELRLLVPAQYEEQALEILQSEISDEELAAQAEAAGAFEEYSEENDDSETR